MQAKDFDKKFDDGAVDIVQDLGPDNRTASESAPEKGQRRFSRLDDSLTR